MRIAERSDGVRSQVIREQEEDVRSLRFLGGERRGAERNPEGVYGAHDRASVGEAPMSRKARTPWRRVAPSSRSSVRFPGRRVQLRVVRLRSQAHEQPRPTASVSEEQGSGHRDLHVHGVLIAGNARIG